jgi:nucleoside-triphosphatase
MSISRNNILITGPPAIGKTTLVKRLFDRLTDFHPSGFYTEEIRGKGRRNGFRLKSSEGVEGILSHVDIQSPYRVSKYGVDIHGFEKFLDKIRLDSPIARLVIIDEIGKMECYSKKFIQIMHHLLDSRLPVIATIALKGGGFIADVRERADIEWYELTRSNRNRALEDIINRFTDLSKEP